jgi:hypothetical protein
MIAQRPAGYVPEEREAKHQQANSDVRGIRPSLPENWRHADISLLITGRRVHIDLVSMDIERIRHNYSYLLQTQFCRSFTSADSLKASQHDLLRELPRSLSET